MIYAIIGVAAIILATIAVIIIRTLTFKPHTKPNAVPDDVCCDVEKAVSDLSQMIKCKTVSDVDRSREDEAEFDKFKALLRKLFPNIYEKCEYEEVGDRGLLYRCKGKGQGAPTVLMAHFDVVSAEEENWEKPAFLGIVENGVIWGRGTLDTKGTLNGAMQALEALLKDGFTPESDVYLAFAGDEEINGRGAPMIVDLFEERGIVPSTVIDEGGAVVQNVFPGVKEPCAVIGIGEKGMLNAEFSCKSNGGHSSSPKPHTPVGKLSAACVRVEAHPFKYSICDATDAMLDTLARHSGFLYRMIFANLWIFGPVLSMIGKRSGGELNALVRTTCAFTQMEGSRGMNVIPPSAKMVANLRILPGETVDSTLEYLTKVVNDPEIEIKKISGMNPSVTSEIGTEGWNRLVEAVNATWTDAIVSPYLMFACSDSRHWGRLCNRVYRFSPMALSGEERATIHGNNECVSVDTVKKTVEFYIRLIKKC